MNRAFFAWSRWATRQAEKLLANVEVRGADLVPRQGPVLLVSNHLNNVDPLLLAAHFPRSIEFLTKAELFNVPILGQLSRWYGGVPIHRGEFDRSAIEQCLGRLRRGEAIGVFPEGTRSRTGGLQAGKAGLSLLAGQSGATLVPVGIWGSEQMKGPQAVLRRPRIGVRFGEPFKLPRQRGRAGHQEYVDQVMIRIAELLPPAYHGVYAGRSRSPAGAVRTSID